MKVFIAPTGTTWSIDSITNMPNLNALSLIGSANVLMINFTLATDASAFAALIPGTPNVRFAATWSGVFQISLEGSYTFCTTSDDGSTLSVDGSKLVDNSGSHSALTVCSSVSLGKGAHSLYAFYFQGPVQVEMRVTYSGPDTRNSQVLLQFQAYGSSTCTSCTPGSYSNIFGE